MTVSTPDWLAQRSAELRQSKDGMHFTVYLRGEPQYLLMPVPAFLWGLASGRGLWYPVNLLAGTVVPGLGQLPVEELQQFNAGWWRYLWQRSGTLYQSLIR